VIAEDLGKHVLLLGLNYRFLPVRPRELLQSVDGSPVGDDDELRLLTLVALPGGHVRAARPGLHHRHTRLDHEALELVLLPRVDADTKDTDDHHFLLGR
jgi:hypothetical protein